LTVERAFAEAFECDERGSSSVTEAQAPPSALPDGLTRREAEVQALLAAGYSNRAIADELVLSVLTVQNHVASIYQKTDLHNRAEAARYAVRHGLAGSGP
jgi:DNA-binding NarL/FixJ family response regulator